MAITETGYHRPTYEEIIEELTLKAQELFGEDIDVSELTPLGKIIHILAYVRAKDHENAELIYYSRFPNTATGTNLDRLCPFVNLTRNVATPAQYQVTVTGAEETTVPIGFLVATESGIEFYNIMDATIEAGQTTCTITVECTEAGTMGNVLPSDITEIVNPDAGIDSVLGLSVISEGTDEESDDELRQRILEAGEGAGAGNEDALRIALLGVPTVKSATVLVNDTSETDSYGNPPHSVACYVAGGEEYSQEIAEAIFEKKPLGIGTNGTIEVEVLDTGGYSHIIRYNYVATINVTVSVSISTTADFEGETGITKIQNNIMSYINNLGCGNDVILSALYGYIHAVKGVANVPTLQLSTDGATFTTDDVSISELENAVCTTVNVVEV